MNIMIKNKIKILSKQDEIKGAAERGKSASFSARNASETHISFFPTHSKGSNLNAQCNKRKIFY